MNLFRDLFLQEVLEPPLDTPDPKLVEARERFDRNEHLMFDIVSGERKGRRPPTITPP